VPAIRVSDVNSYKTALGNAFLSEGPVVIEAMTNGNEYDLLVLNANK
jgi:hypothetical protein